MVFKMCIIFPAVQMTKLHNSRRQSCINIRNYSTTILYYFLWTHRFISIKYDTVQNRVRQSWYCTRLFRLFVGIGTALFIIDREFP